MEKFYADLHCHPSMKPFRSSMEDSKKNDIWQNIDEQDWDIRVILNLKKLKNDKSFKELIKYSEANLNKCISSNTRLLFLSIYPVEIQWFNLITDLISRKKKCEISAWASGFDLSVVTDVVETIRKDGPVHYFEEAEKEYKYLVSQENSSTQEKEIIIATDYSKVESVINNKGSIIVILTIEGGASLFNFNSFSAIEESYGFLESGEQYDFYFQQLNSNIEKLKRWGNMYDDTFHNHTPLFISLAHHFWGLLCGHAQSMNSPFLDQETGLNNGLTQLGKKALELLLSRKNGRRILIDIKHMSVQSRKDFYSFWKNYGDKFPIICSHTGIAGINTLDELENEITPDETTYYNPVAINLADEDIRNIFESDGLIGIIMNEERLPGEVTKNKLKPYIDSYKKNGNNPQLIEYIRTEYAKLILLNVIRIIDICKSERAWDMVCIGSDFDGMINDLTGFEDVTTFPVMERIMLSLLDQPISLVNPHAGYYTESQISELLCNYKPEEIVAKLFYKNTMDFLKKYYTQDYLKGTV